jgi:hypothetical protein
MKGPARETIPFRLAVSSRSGRPTLMTRWPGPVTGRPLAERHRSLIAGWAVKPSVQRLSGDECPCRAMVLSAVGMNRRMMVSEAPVS